MTPRERSALHETEIALREVLHAVRDPLIDKGTKLFFSALRRQRRALINHGLGALSLRESDPIRQHQIEGALSVIPPLDQMMSELAYTRLVVKTFVKGANQSGVMLDMTFGENTQFVKDYVAENSLAKIGKDIDDTTRDRLRTVLAADVEKDATLAQIIKDVKAAGAFSRARAETISITEIGNAYSQGTLNAAQAMGDSGAMMEKSWLSEGDCCDICDGNSSDDWIPIDDDFSSGDDAPLAHPNCFPSGSRVSASGVHAATSRAYSGELIVIGVAGDCELAVTPNHPILSLRGWVQAEDVQIGDYLLKCRDESAAVSLINPDDNDIEVRIEKIANSLLMAGGVAARGVPTSTEAFHGDASSQNKVDIVSSARYLPRESSAEILSNEFLGRIESRGIELACSGSLAALGVGHSSTPHGSVSSGGQTRAFGGVGPSHANERGRASVTLAESSGVQPSGDCASIAPESMRHRLDAFSALMSAVEITTIRKIEFSGHVHNLETDVGFYFVSGIVVHNCRCALLTQVAKED